ncbi:CerR family C-terminal domain-containing protein [Rhizorhapis sp. SPR117]|uniref:CerR family C-terminal domain-containing protein n=1 Tax=Rhizorhapis sp. SPR117 TaxID=2912611 RepID=UPI001F2A8CD0|nr:CerR family C-terminal domain-containing protein [Rhizorhapis sp. SPR117]
MIENRLLETAIKQFGRNGLEGASTRTIAKAAGTAMSSITYHYGGKEGLYLAAADHIARQIREQMTPIMSTMLAEPQNLAPEEAASCIVMVVDRLAQILLGRESANWAGFIVREQMQPTEAFERLYSGAMGPMMALLAGLVQTATGMTDRQEIRLLVLTIVGQVLVFRAAHATTLHVLELTSIDEATGAAIRARIQNNVKAILAAARGEA